jgi:hypothetical protein
MNKQREDTAFLIKRFGINPEEKKIFLSDCIHLLERGEVIEDYKLMLDLAKSNEDNSRHFTWREVKDKLDFHNLGELIRFFPHSVFAHEQLLEDGRIRIEEIKSRNVY